MLKAMDRGYQNGTNPIILHLANINCTNYAFFSLWYFCHDETQRFAPLQQVRQTVIMCKHTKEVKHFLRPV